MYVPQALPNDENVQLTNHTEPSMLASSAAPSSAAATSYQPVIDFSVNSVLPTPIHKHLHTAPSHLPQTLALNHAVQVNPNAHAFSHTPIVNLLLNILLSIL